MQSPAVRGIRLGRLLAYKVYAPLGSDKSTTFALIKQGLPGFDDIQHLRCRLSTGADNEDMPEFGFIFFITRLQLLSCMHMSVKSQLNPGQV